MGFVETDNFTAADFWQHEKFLDTSDFKEWLSRESIQDDEINEDTGKYHFIYNIVQELTEFRFWAEENYKNNAHIAKNSRNELPIPFEAIKAKYAEEQTEPPEQVVSRIAQSKLNVLEAVIRRPRKVLRKEREQVRLSNVQQIDSQCLAWLSRQPGITAVQKAGMKQRMLAVVSRENYDILENRVLKTVLKLCSAYCHRYLLNYREKFKDTERIKAVQRLYNTARFSLKQEFFGNIKTLAGMPQPNYVLLYDQNYSQIWEMFIDLLRQTALVENAWRNRNHLLGQYLHFALANVMTMRFEMSLLFESLPWISMDIRNDGQFIRNTSFHRMFAVNGVLCHLKPVRKSLTWVCSSASIAIGQNSHYVSLVYIPAYATDKQISLPKEASHTYLVFAEGQRNLLQGRKDVIVLTAEKEFFAQLTDWFAGMEFLNV